jgi:hypothetical protein
MAEFSYSVRATVDKELPPVSSGDYDIDFCSAGNASQTPPKLRVSLAAFGTSNVEGVVAECFTANTQSVTILTPTTFGTATNAYLYIQDAGNSTVSSAIVSSSSTTEFSTTSFAQIGQGQAAIVPVRSSNSYAVYSSTTAATCSVQVLVIGD